MTKPQITWLWPYISARVWKHIQDNGGGDDRPEMGSVNFWLVRVDVFNFSHLKSSKVQGCGRCNGITAFREHFALCGVN